MILAELHEAHLGIVKMKAIARSFVWWPKLDKAIEETAKDCRNCQQIQHVPPLTVLHPWIWPSKPWQRIHVDFAGPFMNTMFFVVVDAHSKWPEVVMMKSTTSTKTIKVLHDLFAPYGLPLQLVSDNGPQFVSEEFSKFFKQNGIKHCKSAPFHPATKGLAERFVQSLKQGLRASHSQEDGLSQKLSQFLIAYRSAPHSTTKETPSTLFLGRNLRTRLDLVKPKIDNNVTQQQSEQVKGREKKAKSRDYMIGESVICRNYRRGDDKWLKGTIVSKKGPMSYCVQLNDGNIIRRHIDQIRNVNDDAEEPKMTTQCNNVLDELSTINRSCGRDLP